jgi:hypothetical protein
MTDYEREVIRSGPVRSVLGVSWTYEFTPRYPSGQVTKVVVFRRPRFEYVVTIFLKDKPVRQLLNPDQWNLVEDETRRFLLECDCKPFELDTP